MCRASNLLLSIIVMVVALIEWFVYIVDNSARCKMTECVLAEFLLHQMTLVAKKVFIHWIQDTHTFFKGSDRQKGPSFAIIIPPSSAWTSCALWFFVSSSVVFTTQRFVPCELTFISQSSVFLSCRKFCRPRRKKNNIISKKTLFYRVVGFSVLKTPHRYNLFMSSSAIGGLCSVFASPYIFSCTHCAS